MKPWLLNKILGFIPKVGDRVHLHSIEGMYLIVEISKSTVKVTCNAWKIRNPKTSIREFPLKDLKCHVNGIYSLRN